MVSPVCIARDGLLFKFSISKVCEMHYTVCSGSILAISCVYEEGYSCNNALLIAGKMLNTITKTVPVAKKQ